MTFILIILFSMNNAAPLAVEFDDEEACKKAGQKMETVAVGVVRAWACVAKGT